MRGACSARNRRISELSNAATPPNLGVDPEDVPMQMRIRSPDKFASRLAVGLGACALLLSANAQQIEPAEIDHWTEEPYVERYTTMIFIVHPIMARQFQQH